MPRKKVLLRTFSFYRMNCFLLLPHVAVITGLASDIFLLPNESLSQGGHKSWKPWSREAKVNYSQLENLPNEILLTTYSNLSLIVPECYRCVKIVMLLSDQSVFKNIMWTKFTWKLSPWKSLRAMSRTSHECVANSKMEAKMKNLL